MSYRHINIWYIMILGDGILVPWINAIMFFMPFLCFMVVMFFSLILLFSESF